MVTTNNSFAAVDISTMFSKSIFTIFVFAIFVMPPGPVSCIAGTKYPHCIVHCIVFSTCHITPLLYVFTFLPREARSLRGYSAIFLWYVVCLSVRV